MKKSQIIILIVLLAAAGYLYFTKSNSTINKRDANFAYNDTTLINKVFLENKDGSVTLEKEINQWIVNKSHIANKHAINSLLKTIHDIHVKEPVPSKDIDDIIREMDKTSTMVEIYSNNKLIKTIYIGHSSPRGSYMMLDGSDAPYITEVPGYDQPISHFFSTEELKWRSHILFNYTPNNIAKIKLSYVKTPEKSFELTINDNKIKLNGTEIKQQEYIIKAQQYLMGFQNIAFSRFTNNVPQQIMDSVIANLKFAELTITDNSGKLSTYEAFYKPGWNKKDESGKTIHLDPDYFFIKNSSNEILLVKYFVFDPIMRELSQFSNTNSIFFNNQ